MISNQGRIGSFAARSEAMARAMAASALALALSGCIFSTLSPFEGEKVAGGGGIETVGIRGYAYNEGGKPVAGARVRLRTREFLADSGIAGLLKQKAVISGETVTDNRGHYGIDSVDPGEYLIEVGDIDDSLGAVVEASVVAESRLQQIDAAVLRKTGSIMGRLAQSGYYVSGAWVHIYGMQRALSTDSYGRFSLKDLPEGTYRLVFRRLRPYGYVSTMSLNGIRIEAGKVLDIGLLEMPAGCPDYRCDSLVVRHILDRNGRDTISVDSVALKSASTGRIEELDLSRIGITTTPEIQDLVTLKRLELDNNQLEVLPLEVTRITTLEYLSLNNNRLRSLPYQIGNMKFLVWLHVYNNSLDTLTPAIGNLTSLRYLTVSYNYLPSIPTEMGRLSNLNQLFMHHNRLTDLPESLLALPKLSVLDIHANRLCNLNTRWVAFLDTGSDYDWRANQTCP